MLAKPQIHPIMASLLWAILGAVHAGATKTPAKPYMEGKGGDLLLSLPQNSTASLQFHDVDGEVKVAPSAVSFGLSSEQSEARKLCCYAISGGTPPPASQHMFPVSLSVRERVKFCAHAARRRAIAH